MEKDYLIYLSFLSGMIAFIFMLKNIKAGMYIFLFTSAFLIRVFIAEQDNYLHNYDERYHALVGKNMAEHPFKPMLRTEPVLPYDYTSWTGNHIWVHKQPFFLWQIAASIKLLGPTEFAVRLPSVIMGALATILILSMGTYLFNKKVGFAAALMFCFSFYQLEQTAGVIGMDHNDISFMFYTTLSIWCYLKYLKQGSIIFIVGIGVFSGIAILNKWLPGLFIFGVWGIHSLLDRFIIHKNIEYLKITGALLLSFLTFIPWQIYVWKKWPLESAYEYEFNTRHFTEVLEGHSGEWYHYLNLYSQQYGQFSILLLILGLIFIFRKGQNKTLWISFITCIIIVYVVFSIAKSKSYSYVYYIAPLIILIFSKGLIVMIDYISDFFKQNYIRYAFLFVTLFGISAYIISFRDIKFSHVKGKSMYTENEKDLKLWNTAIYREIDNIAPDVDIIFNCKSMCEIDAMFYSSKNVYAWFPPENTIDSLKNIGYKLGAFESFDSQKLPEYIVEDNDIQIINRKQK
ncbi:MAG: glycosyltransferase family 39 protein [Bacteroidetes bacterium]|nr:glycosyltransferase family 39 protein [Bacteroidota bacterium]